MSFFTWECFVRFLESREHAYFGWRGSSVSNYYDDVIQLVAIHVCKED